MGCWARPVCDSLGVAGCPGITCSSSSTCHSEGRAAASSRVGAAGGGEPQGSLRVPRMGAGEHKSALDLILSLVRKGWKAFETQKTPMVYARKVYKPQSPALC